MEEIPGRTLGICRFVISHCIEEWPQLGLTSTPQVHDDNSTGATEFSYPTVLQARDGWGERSGGTRTEGPGTVHPSQLYIFFPDPRRLHPCRLHVQPSVHQVQALYGGMGEGGLISSSRLKC